MRLWDSPVQGLQRPGRSGLCHCWMPGSRPRMHMYPAGTRMSGKALPGSQKLESMCCTSGLQCRERALDPHESHDHTFCS